jgi:GTP-binding protein HflX
VTQTASAIAALVLHPALSKGAGRDPTLRLEEAAGLAAALDLDVKDARVEPVRELRPGTYFGRGKVDEIGERARTLGASVVVIDAAVTPVQQRNLERAWNVKVIDRTGLILEIFARRARTREGRLQVELARLTYERSRLVRTWTHLERQRGGRGFLAGPGETQIEADRRMLNERVSKLKRELEDVRRTRGLHRESRKKVPFPLIALVGYTNAGKSTLFNAVTHAGVLAKDMPFATLDTTMRGVRLPSGARAMLSDTVGFISELPHDLVEAFRATLEEVREADLLIHVRDVAHAESESQKDDVESVLERLEAGEPFGQRLIEVWNKADQLDADDLEVAKLKAARSASEGGPRCVVVSALSRLGLETLVAEMDATVTEDAQVFETRIEPGDGRARAWLHEHGDVLFETAEESGAVTVTVRLSALAAGRYERAFGTLTAAKARKDILSS